MLDLDSKAKQVPFAELVGLSQQGVSRHFKAGVLPVGGSYRDWLRALYAHLAEMAAGRADDEDGAFSLVGERARLAAEQADRVAMDNAVRRAELAPRGTLEATLADASRQVVAILDGVPAQVKRASAGIKARELDVVKREIDKARAAIADIRLAT